MLDKHILTMYNIDVLKKERSVPTLTRLQKVMGKCQ